MFARRAGGLGAAAAVPEPSSFALLALGEVDAAGDIITYQITVMNDGNQSIAGVVLTDPLIALGSGLSAPVSSGGTGSNLDAILDVGETFTYTGTYTVSQSDIDDNATSQPDEVAAGFIDNTASVVSTQITIPQTSSQQVPLVQDPSYVITKTVTDVDGDGPNGEVDAAGDIITYSIVVTNTGNQTITGVVLTDTLVAAVGTETESISINGDLNLGETWTWTYGASPESPSCCGT